MTKGIIYYTDNRADERINRRVRSQLLSIGLPITSVSLKPVSNFGHNIVLPLERGMLTMFTQILTALENANEDVVFFCEHDVLYHPSHFDFTPSKRDTFYYNVNVWKVRAEDGHAVWVDNCQQVSGICVYREDAIKHYRERIEFTKNGTWTRGKGFEPGHKQRRLPWTHLFNVETWMSAWPNLDIRYNHNLTANRWSTDKFRDKSTCQNWTETQDVPYWGHFRLDDTDDTTPVASPSPSPAA